MERYRCTGAITVFLSLVSVLVLSLICTLAESARVQGARAQASAVTDLGLFSVFAEYDRDLLESFDVLFLDGSYGGGSFDQERIALQLRNYMEYNIEPAKGLNVPLKFPDISYVLWTDTDYRVCSGYGWAGSGFL